MQAGADKCVDHKDSIDSRAFVEGLKLQRMIALSRMRPTLIGRARRKCAQLLFDGFSLPAIAAYFLNRFLVVSRRVLTGSVPQSAGAARASDHHYAEPVFVALRITGGVGDAVIVARFLASLSSEADGDQYVVDIFYNKPDNVKFIFNEACRVRAVIEEPLFERIRWKYDVSGVANQFLTFDIENGNWPKIIGRAPRLCAAVRTSERKRRDFEPFIRHHPLLDGSFADTAVRIGCTRHTFLHYQTEMPLKEAPLRLELSTDCLEKFGLVPGSYLTVHDGWDAEYRLVATRPTKAYRPEMWEAVVARIKQEFPLLTIVQLGGQTGQSIANVDVDLRSRTSLEEAAAIIQSAVAHVDTESGLVHLARCLGTTSVVLFGPTNPDYFGYRENRNIVSGNCGNCWWSTDTWMDACPRGLSTPACLDAILPARVAAEVSRLVGAKLDANEGLKESLA